MHQSLQEGNFLTLLHSSNKTIELLNNRSSNCLLIYQNFLIIHKNFKIFTIYYHSLVPTVSMNNIMFYLFKNIRIYRNIIL